MSRLKFLTAVFLFFFATQAIYGQVEHLDSILFAQAKKQLKEDVYNKLDQQMPTFEFFTHRGEWIHSDRLPYNHTVLFLRHWSCQPCLDLFEDLGKLHKEYNQSVNFIAITSGDISITDDYLDFRSFPFDIVTTAKPYIDELGIKNVPKLLFVDADLRLLHILDTKSQRNGDLNLDRLRHQLR